MEITKVPPSARGFQPLLIWSPRFRHRVSSRSAEEKTAGENSPIGEREGGKGGRGGRKPVSQGCKGKRRTEKGKSRARAGRDTVRDTKRQDGETEGRGGEVRIGGGLKGSERLDKSNPLKVRPTLCLPMRLRISRLRVPDSLKGSVPRSGKEKSHERHRAKTRRGRA